MRKYAAVATKSDMARKCTKTKMSVSRTMPAAEYVVATLHATPVRSMNKERRYVKDGSGRCHVFLVSKVDGVSVEWDEIG